MAKKKKALSELSEIVETMPVTDMNLPPLCVCGHDKSSHNGINKSCSRFIDADQGGCLCLGYVQLGTLVEEPDDG